MKTSAILLTVCLVCYTYTRAAPTEQPMFARLPADLYDVIKNQARHWCCVRRFSTRDAKDQSETGHGPASDESVVDDPTNCKENYRAVCCEGALQIGGMCMPLHIAAKNAKVLKELQNSGLLQLLG